ncbi:hypothetical protein C8R44DRAFT_724415 [Mycena epipterygia]|nr:hypothetical protein C8R44DRAFT_724415 [Mycena epipterygia]
MFAEVGSGQHARHRGASRCLLVPAPESLTAADTKPNCANAMLVRTNGCGDLELQGSCGWLPTELPIVQRFWEVCEPRADLTKDFRRLERGGREERMLSSSLISCTVGGRMGGGSSWWENRHNGGREKKLWGGLGARKDLRVFKAQTWNLSRYQEFSDAFGTLFIPAIANTTVSLINLVKNVKKNKGECIQLMEDIYELLYAVVNLHMKSGTGSSLPPETLSNTAQGLCIHGGPTGWEQDQALLSSE